MKILVTGGAGFIGSNFIRYMLGKYPGYEFVNLDKLTYAGNLQNLKDVEKDPRYSFIKGDICEEATVVKAVAGCDAVINFAAETHVDRSITAPSSFVQTDVIGTQVILDVVNKRKIGKFLQISTDEVYGSTREGSFKETDPLMPNSPYSAAKAAADLLCRAYFKTYNTPVIVTRSSNNFGPFQYPEKLISLLITNALDGKKLPVYGNGSNVRDWIFVLDNCSAIDSVLGKGAAGEVYNIGGGREEKNIDIAREILKLTGQPEELIKFVADRPGHDFRYSLDVTKMRQLGWSPDFDFETALEKTIAWYRENQAWWRPLKAGSDEQRTIKREHQ